MKKLSKGILYECATSFKYIWIFYGCVFAVISIISAIAYVSTGSFDKVGTNGLEINSMIYVGILGVMGFKDDFKMLIQNGFTRKYIFLCTFSLFVFVSAIMALVDVILGNVLHMVSKGYESVFSMIYGYGHSHVLNWLWLFLVYMTVCCLLYFIVLAMNRIGKMSTLIAGSALGLVVVLILPALYRFVLPAGVKHAIMEALMRGMGFMADGTVNHLYPLAVLFLLTGFLGSCAYVVIRKTELKV